jgi:ribosome-associated protein
VETKVELRFDVHQSAVLTDSAKHLIKERLSNKISGEGILVLQHQTERSQLANKIKVLAKFDELIKKALIPAVRRKKTRPPAAVEANRRRAKERTSEIKKWRAKPEI